jgi:acyl-[acyl carrier protein]--UDP-N-acetylglucosamine O-acyltransferase
LARRGFGEEQIICLKAAYRLLFKDTTPMATQAVELQKLYPNSAEIEVLLNFMRESTNGKFGRARENLRRKTVRDVGDEPPPHVSGN